MAIVRNRNRFATTGHFGACKILNCTIEELKAGVESNRIPFITREGRTRFIVSDLQQLAEQQQRQRKTAR